MKICLNCQNPLLDGACFCAACGTKIETPSAVETPVETTSPTPPVTVYPPMYAAPPYQPPQPPAYPPAQPSVYPPPQPPYAMMPTQPPAYPPQPPVYAPPQPKVPGRGKSIAGMILCIVGLFFTLIAASDALDAFLMLGDFSGGDAAYWAEESLSMLLMLCLPLTVVGFCLSLGSRKDGQTGGKTTAGKVPTAIMKK